MAVVVIGRRDKLVTIQHRPSADTVDEGGYPIDDGVFTLLDDEWMSKRDIAEMGTAERFAAAQVSASFDTEWEMPYRSTMDPDVIDVPKLRRLVYRGRTYDIVHATRTEASEGDVIKLRTLAASGVTA
jgi:hypothetical protein